MIEIVRLYRQVLTVIPKEATRYLTFYSLTLGLLSVIDSFAIGLVALVIAPLATGGVLEIPFLGSFGDDSLIVLLVIASLVIILKSVGASVLLWFATRRFARYEVSIGDRLFDAYVKAPWVMRLSKNSSDLVRIAETGVSNSIHGFILPIASLLGELLTFLSILLILVVSQPVTAIASLGYFAVIAAFLFLWLARHAKLAGKVAFDASLRVARLLTEMVKALKEITLYGKTGEVTQVIQTSRRSLARARANAFFLSGIPRYVMDAALIGGFLLVGAMSYLIGGMGAAFGAVAMFSLAGFRMIPSLSRFQAVLNQAQVTSPYVVAVIRDIQESEELRQQLLSDQPDSLELPEQPQSIEMRNVSFRYPNASELALDNLSLTVPLGKKIAFVGPSGAGKTTVVDVLLGLLSPQSGFVSIGDVPLSEVLHGWRSLIGYLPQEVSLFDGTIEQNVVLSWDQNSVDSERVVRSLKKAQLWSLVSQRDEGVQSRVGDQGLSLSGGQKQRLGIARVLYQQRPIIVMDEGTSALDTKTEASITRAIAELSRGSTLIAVAHRLSTIKDFDIIFYMKNGAVVGSGTFVELVESVPEFAEQAQLAGLG